MTEGIALVVGLAELLDATDLDHLILVEDGPDRVQLRPVDGWRRFELHGVDQDEHVLQRMTELDDGLWPTLARDAGTLSLSDGDGEHYRGEDADALLGALSALLEKPAVRNPIMRMSASETDDGFGIDVSYSKE